MASAAGPVEERETAQPPQVAAQEADCGAGGAAVAPGSSGDAVGAKDGRKREAEAGAGEEGDERRIDIKVVFGKQSTTTSRPLSSTVAELKQDIAAHTGVPPENQKLLFKGQLKDEQTLEAAGLKSGSKVIVMGSRPEEIKVTALGKGAAAGGAGDWDDKPATEPWSDQEQHRKALAKGRPDDGWPGVKDRQVPLRDDQTYIPGLLNSQGTKVRLTFKPELQQLWVGSAVSTQKVMYSSITKIESQPIKGQEEYSIVRMQVGSAGTSNLWLYFVPSQAVSGIKLRILGVGALL
ncbi:hypothetical protein ABPG75_012120 [Micractinium tetrahymenae]